MTPEIKMIAVDALLPHARNARTHSLKLPEDGVKLKRCVTAILNTDRINGKS